MKHFWRVCLFVVWLAGATGPAAAAPIAASAAELPEYPAAFTAAGGTLLLSDSPEMVAGDGILYQDRVAGDVRLFFYHVNATGTAKQLAVVLENNGAKPAHVVIRRAGLGGPGRVWMAVGKEALTNYLNGATQRRLTVAPGGSAALAGEIGDSAMLPNTLINGIYDFTADQPVTVKVMMLPPFTDCGDFARKARVLAADEVHLRGTFSGADRAVVPLKAYDPLTHGAVALTLADNKVDGYLQGTDATDGSKVVNYGNYGVVYRIALASTTKVRFGCYLTPMGGEYAGAIGVRYQGVEQGAVATPQKILFFGRRAAEEEASFFGRKGAEGFPYRRRGTDDFALVGFFDGGQPLALTFSPPGGSNLPVRLVIVPEFYY